MCDQWSLLISRAKGHPYVCRRVQAKILFPWILDTIRGIADEAPAHGWGGAQPTAHHTPCAARGPGGGIPPALSEGQVERWTPHSVLLVCHLLLEGPHTACFLTSPPPPGTGLAQRSNGAADAMANPFSRWASQGHRDGITWVLRRPWTQSHMYGHTIASLFCSSIEDTFWDSHQSHIDGLSYGYRGLDSLQGQQRSCPWSVYEAHQSHNSGLL